MNIEDGPVAANLINQVLSKQWQLSGSSHKLLTKRSISLDFHPSHLEPSSPESTYTSSNSVLKPARTSIGSVPEGGDGAHDAQLSSSALSSPSHASSVSPHASLQDQDPGSPMSLEQQYQKGRLEWIRNKRTQKRSPAVAAMYRRASVGGCPTGSPGSWPSSPLTLPPIKPDPTPSSPVYRSHQLSPAASISDLSVHISPSASGPPSPHMRISSRLGMQDTQDTLSTSPDSRGSPRKERGPLGNVPQHQRGPMRASASVPNLLDLHRQPPVHLTDGRAGYPAPTSRMRHLSVSSAGIPHSPSASSIGDAACRTRYVVQLPPLPIAPVKKSSVLEELESEALAEPPPPPKPHYRLVRGCMADLEREEEEDGMQEGEGEQDEGGEQVPSQQQQSGGAERGAGRGGRARAGGKPRPVVVCVVGEPNVGKSSTMNALLGTHRVAVSSHPGRTKHYQTHYMGPNLMLCDCPGLVFPRMDVSLPMQILFGSYPIARCRDPYTVLQFLAERIWPRLHVTLGLRKVLPEHEGQDAQAPGTRDAQVGGPAAASAAGDHSPAGAADLDSCSPVQLWDEPWSTTELCEALAAKKGWRSRKGGRLDVYRAANWILRAALNGKNGVCLSFLPPADGA